jgi:hypothetical protein
MKIELVYFDGCAFWQRGLKNLEAALQEQGLAQSVELVKVNDEADASRLKFLGSPSFCINGQDLWPEELESYSLSCRLYCTPQGLKGYPTVSMLKDELEKFKKV